MRIVCIGGGPSGLYFGLLMKKRHPEHAVTVIERNKPYDTFGWGVVFSDAMMSAMRAADPESAAEIADAFNHWDDIELVFKGSRQRTSGHGFIGIGRKQLLNILQRRCEALGVELAFEYDVNSDLEFPEADLIVASDAFTFDFRKTEHGWFQAHIYKFDRKTSTFIVETTDEAFEAHGLGGLDQDASIAFCEKLFAETLGGAKLMTNARHMRGSAWLNFNRLICGQWSCFNGRSHVVLMGEATRSSVSRRRSRLMRRFAASMLRASRTRRATRWNGSRWSAGATRTRLSRRSSSIRCCRARNGSATRT